MMKYLFILLISILLLSCKPNISESQSETLNMIQTSIDSSDYFLSQVDSAFAIDATVTFNENMNYIKAEMPDTLDNETMLYIDKYYGLRKGFRRMGENYLATVSELETSKEQMSNLRHDIENGLVEENQLDQYLTLEEENITLVFQSSKSISEMSTKLVPLFKEMNPKIDSIILASKEKYNK